MLHARICVLSRFFSWINLAIRNCNIKVIYILHLLYIFTNLARCFASIFVKYMIRDNFPSIYHKQNNIHFAWGICMSMTYEDHLKNLNTCHVKITSPCECHIVSLFSAGPPLYITSLDNYPAAHATSFEKSMVYSIARRQWLFRGLYRRAC